MKVVVAGTAGQLGTEFTRLLQREGINVTGIARNDLDLAAEPESIAAAISSYRADWVVNCAAYTQVDKAESEADIAYAVNRDAAGAIARGAQQSGARLLQISTDFVFGDDKGVPYAEKDTAQPLGVYGASKYEGELAVLEECPQAQILRTAWVYGAHGHNFVKTVLRVAAEREELRVVDDQIGTPSWTGDIAHAMFAMINSDAAGVYHFTNEGVASWYDLAREIVEMGKEVGFAIAAQRVLPIPSEEYPTPAKRPHYSVLSKKRIRSLLPEPIPHWRDSIGTMLEELYQCTKS